MSDSAFATRLAVPLACLGIIELTQLIAITVHSASRSSIFQIATSDLVPVATRYRAMIRHHPVDLLTDTCTRSASSALTISRII